MATSSIKKNFIIETKEQAEIFANAIEASEQRKTSRIKVKAKQISGEKEVLKLMKKKAKYK